MESFLKSSLAIKKKNIRFVIVFAKRFCYCQIFYLLLEFKQKEIMWKNNSGNNFVLKFCTIISFFLLNQPKDISGQNPHSAEVKPACGKPTLYVDGKPEYPMIYALTDLPGGRLTYEEMPQHNIRRMYDAGVRIFYFCLMFDEMWKSENDSLDITPAQKLIRGITDICPEAKVIIRLHVNPPIWWNKIHKAECTKYADSEAVDYDKELRFQRILQNDPTTINRYSLASKLWQNTMSAKVANFTKKLASTSEGNYVIGMQLAGGIYGEWHYWGFMKNNPDVSLPMQLHFKSWLKEKYKTNNALQKAWSDGSLTFDNVFVPEMNERNDVSNGLFPKNQKLADYYKCQHELVADNIISFCKIVKQNWNRPIITGTFYGYTFPVFSREAVGGHLEIQKILNSPFVDYLSGPQCYYPDAQKPGEPARSRSLNTTIRLNGKLWLDEYDHQTDLTAVSVAGASPAMAGYDSVMNRARSEVRRNMAVSAVNGQGFWFFDFGVAGARIYNELAADVGSNGYWDYPELLSDIKQSKAIFEKQSAKPFTSNADVLMIYDTEVYYNLSINKNLLVPTTVNTYWMSAATWKAGIAADYIHIEDLNKVNMAQYKVVIFNNTYRITTEQLKLIKEKVLNNNRNVIWMYAPGYFDGKNYSTSNMKALTGFNFTLLRPTKAYEVTINRKDFEYQYGVSKKPVDPLFVVDDAQAESIGLYIEIEKPAIARKKLKNYTSWYVGLPEYGDKLMKFLLKESGAHFYVDNGEIVYEGNNMLVIHSTKEGLHNIILKNGKEIKCEFPKGGATLVLDSETGEELIR